MFRLTRILLLGGVAGKVLGVFRELLAAWLFGTGNIASAFRLSQAAFTLPLHALVSDTLTVAFIPSFSRRRESDPAGARLLFALVHATLIVVSVLVAVGLWFFADRWVMILAPGFAPEASDLATRMTRVLALSMPFYVLTALYSAVDLSMGSGRLTAFRASVQSLGLIAGSLAAYQWLSPTLIAAGFSLAYFCLALRGMETARRESLPLWPGRGSGQALRTLAAELWASFRILIWLPVIAQISTIIERQTASIVHPGANAGLDYARFISETAIVLVAMPFGSAGLSAMSQMSVIDFRRAATTSLRSLAFVGIPLSSVCATHAELIVRLLFSRGAFNEDSVRVTSAILTGLSAGLFGQLMGYAGAKFMNSRGENRTVLLLSVIAMGTGIAINLAGRSLGPAVLGVSTGAYGVIFGGLVVWRLGLLAELLPDFAWLASAAVAYALIVRYAGVASWHPYAALAMAVVLWSAALGLVPRNRRFLTAAYRTLQT